jgi:hypothetical protein
MKSDSSATSLDVAPSTAFCLVLVLWGRVFGDASVNNLVHSVRKYSKNLHTVVLLTDHYRPGIDPLVKQNIFPDFFNRSEFFGHGYRVKISMFSNEVLPSSMPCIYLDLDTLVTGDVGKIASLVKKPSDILMLPPGNLISFGVLRRALFKLSSGGQFATGNSSVVAFHSGAKPNLSDVFEERFRSGDVGRHMQIDDIFISWAGQLNLRGIPSSLAVPFRREFLSRFAIVLWWRKVSSHRKAIRANIVAVTFNGAEYKPHELLGLKNGDRILDRKGRFGFWSDDYMGQLRQKIIDYCLKVV